jgi:uncharacterized protein
VSPIVVLVPVLAFVFGPRIWVGHVLKRHNQRDLPCGRSARNLARELLDKNKLHAVKVESTDAGDHYDPIAKAVRLSRDTIDRRTLTALTTSAHEVSHALQDASDYSPFVWRSRLVKVAQRAGEVGAILFLAVPLAGFFTSYRLPQVLIGSAILAILGTGLVAQLATLPSELDASFGRALPMLSDGYINEQQGQDARKILLTCSLTYVASSLVAVLRVWPWIGHPPMVSLSIVHNGFGRKAPVCNRVSQSPKRSRRTSSGVYRPGNRAEASVLEKLIRPIGKPLIRAWFRATGMA